MTCSVLIPSQGKRESLLETLESIYRQTKKPDKVNILIGEGRKLNELVENCGTDTFVLLGDDDKLAPTYLEKTLEKIQTCDIVSVGMQTFQGDNGYFSPHEWTLENMRANRKPYFSSLCRTKVWEKIGFDYEVGKCLDWDFWWRAYKSGFKAELIDEPLFFYRIHGGQDSRSGCEESNLKVFQKNDTP